MSTGTPFSGRFSLPVTFGLYKQVSMLQRAQSQTMKSIGRRFFGSNNLEVIAQVRTSGYRAMTQIVMLAPNQRPVKLMDLPPSFSASGPGFGGSGTATAAAAIFRVRVCSAWLRRGSWKPSTHANNARNAHRMAPQSTALTGGRARGARQVTLYASLLVA